MQTGPACVRVAVDAMGGDYAPGEIVRGALAASASLGVEVLLVGDTAQIEPLVAEVPGPHRFRIVHAPESVAMTAQPVEAVRRGDKTSIVVTAELVREGEADAMVSAGHTGAAMAAALLKLGRLPGVERPAVCSLMPTIHGCCLLVDAGANVDSRPSHLVQFAEMASIYASDVLGIERPRVGLLNIGEEETKGSELAVKVHQLLREREDLNFIGNVEGRDISWGKADVVVCDGFVGNVVLKFAEGMGTALMKLIRDEVMRDVVSKIGGMLIRPAIERVKKHFDYTEYGGAPLLGVRGVCIISHGRSNAKAIMNAVRVAAEAVQRDTTGTIAARLEKKERAV